MAKKSTRYLESPANEWEDSFDYRVTWGERRRFHYEGASELMENLGPGEELYRRNYDGAYDRYCSMYDDYHYRDISLYRIHEDGTEELLRHAK